MRAANILITGGGANMSASPVSSSAGTVMAAEVLELHPSARAVGVAGAIRRRHLAQFGGHRREFGRADAAPELDERFVLHAADAVGDDEAAQALWK